MKKEKQKDLGFVGRRGSQDGWWWRKRRTGTAEALEDGEGGSARARIRGLPAKIRP